MRYPCTLIQKQVIRFGISWHLKTNSQLSSSIIFVLHLAWFNILSRIKLYLQPIIGSRVLLYDSRHHSVVGKIHKLLFSCVTFHHKSISKHFETENQVCVICDPRSWIYRPVVHTVESSTKFGFGYWKSAFGILCILLSSLTTCESVSYVQANPMSISNIRPYPVKTQRNKPPRVFMPPLDLGFRGQTSSSDRGTPLRMLHSQNYQSDQSAANNWQVNLAQQASGYKVSPGEAKPHYSTLRQPNEKIQAHSGRFYSLMAVPLPQSRLPHNYYDSQGENGQLNEDHYGDESYNPPLVRIQEHMRPNQPPNGYISHDLSQVHSSRHEPHVPRQIQYFHSPDSRSHRVPYDNQGQPVSNTRLPWYGSHSSHSGSYWNVYPYQQGWQNNPNAEEHSRYGYHGSDISHNAVGHPSNYQPITEDEMSVRLKEYREEENRLAQLNIPTLPSISEEQLAQGNAQDSRTHNQDSGLLLVGNAKHDQVVQNFRRLASGWTLPAVEALFDEIDTNRDGVIKVDELRNFLWLHEVLVPG